MRAGRLRTGALSPLVSFASTRKNHVCGECRASRGVFRVTGVLARSEQPSEDLGTAKVASSDKARRREFRQHTPADVPAAATALALELPPVADSAYIDTLLAAYAAAAAEASAAATLEQSRSWEVAAQKCNEVYGAIMNARPTDPIAMSKQIRFLIADSTDREDRMLAHIADQLEAMGLAAT
jgi:hypothetical protein